MPANPPPEPEVLHALPGRWRVHLPGWSGRDRQGVEARLRRAGARDAHANPRTGNVLVTFEPGTTDRVALLDALRAEDDDRAGSDVRPLPDAIQERSGARARARIAVRGLDRDPRIARRVVEQLERRPGVRARANILTGRVLVEFPGHEVTLEALREEVARLEAPPWPGEDGPEHPLDPGPLAQGGLRAGICTAGLGLVGVWRLAGAAAPGGRGVTVASGVINLVQGFPFLRNGLRGLLGRTGADLLLNVACAVTQTLAGDPLGLVVGGAEALRLLTMVLPERAAWLRYEGQVRGAAPTRPGAVLRLGAGARTPRTARVVDGAGTAVGPDGLPFGVAPGARVPAGAPLAGGPLSVELLGERPWLPAPRPRPVSSMYGRHIRLETVLSLAHAGVVAALTGSAERAFEALLLFNPRPSSSGAEGANYGAAARVLRAGVVIAGSRFNRPVRLPGALLLDGPRLLTAGLELASVRPLARQGDGQRLLRLASAVVAAAGSPWGPGLFEEAGGEGRGGSFDGTTATATVSGTRYSLGPSEKGQADPDGEGDYRLLLREAEGGRALALLGFRLRLGEGVPDLVRACRRHGVDLGLVPAADRAAAEAAARRSGIALVSEASALEAGRARQQVGPPVALVADSAGAGEALAACDLGIALCPPGMPFPARADLVAADLRGVTAVVEAGARCDAAVRSSAAWTLLAGAAGAAWGLLGRPGLEKASLPNNLGTLAALLGGWLRLG